MTYKRIYNNSTKSYIINIKRKDTIMKKYFISIEISLSLGDCDATAYYTRLANEAALNEMRKTKVTAIEADYQEDAQSFNNVADVTEITDEEIAVLKKFNLDNISIGNILLLDKNGMESDIPFDGYCSDDKDALLNYVPDAD